MAIKVGLAWLPISSVFCIIVALVASYVIAVQLNHVPPAFTYISDTANFPPERNVFQIMFFLATNFAITTCYIRYKLVDAYFAQHSNDYLKRLSRLNLVALIFGVVSTFGVGVVATFQNIGSTRIVHLIAVAVSVGGFIVYSWLQVHISRFTAEGALVGLSHDSSVVNSHRWSHWFPLFHITVVGRVTSLNSNYMVAIRTTIAACETLTAIGFVVSATIYAISNGDVPLLWNATDPGYANYAIGCVFEWATTVLILIYILTFAPEFRNVHLQTTLSTEPPPAARPSAASHHQFATKCHGINSAAAASSYRYPNWISSIAVIDRN